MLKKILKNKNKNYTRKAIKYLSNKGYTVGKKATAEALIETIRLLKPIRTGHELIRIGAENDGGYLIPDDLENIGYCFSPGVSNKAYFEQALIDQYGIRCFLADFSVKSPPVENDLIDFERKFLGCRDEGQFMKLSTWVNSKIGSTANQTDMLLQMDIEGAEIEVVIDTSPEVFKKFRIMVIEFHPMNLITDAVCLNFFRAVFAKLTEDFVVAHIHPNNCCGIVECDGVEIPKVFEVTFLRKDRVHNEGGNLSFPHRLDSKNVKKKDDLVLPKIWYRQP